MNEVRKITEQDIQTSGPFCATTTQNGPAEAITGNSVMEDWERVVESNNLKQVYEACLNAILPAANSLMTLKQACFLESSLLQENHDLRTT